MQILAISKLKDGVTMDKIGSHAAEEIKHTLEAYLDGKIRSFLVSSKQSWCCVYLGKVRMRTKLVK